MAKICPVDGFTCSDVFCAMKPMSECGFVNKPKDTHTHYVFISATNIAGAYCGSKSERLTSLKSEVTCETCKQRLGIWKSNPSTSPRPTIESK